MSSIFQIGDIKVEPGTRYQGIIEVVRSPLGYPIGLPVMIFNGIKEGKTVVVDAMTHGDETEGALAMLKIQRDLDPKEMSGTLIAVPALNSQAFESNTRGNPFEIHQYDFNRGYPGAENGGLTQRLAHFYLENLIKRADAVITLHGGGTPFYLDGFVIAQNTTAGLELVRAMGWRRFSSAPPAGVAKYAGTLTGYCRELGVASITAEMGGFGFRTPSYLNRVTSEFKRGVRNVMIYYGLIEGEPDRPDTLHRIKRHLFRSSKGGIIELAPGIDIDSEVKEGGLILSIYSMFGELLDEQRSPFDGRIMGLPGGPLASPARILASVYSVEEEIPTIP
ncbi:MAG: hypothetical protein HKM93_02355 [Desulfobacteraceae bacterium]|nr:hypothetical protein [Desulfobacteraceae bacterium]